MRSGSLNHQRHGAECTEICEPVRWARRFACSLICGLFFLAGPADAHRLSGKPKTLEGKLRLAKRQTAHDRAQIAAVRSQHWTLMSPLPAVVVVHRWWLGRDRAHVKRLVAELWLWNSFLCIHRFEGAWNDPNPPYYGGLQMDIGFQRSYGPRLLKAKGTADHWSPLEQITVAVRAYRSGRGFYPWPKTARYCGLI